MSWRTTLRWEVVRRLLGRTLVRAAAGGVVLVALLWLLIATGLGMSLVVPAALGWAAPEGWTVEVGSVEGAWHSRIRLQDLVLEGPHASASVAEVFVDYRVLPLLSRRISLQRVHVVRPEVRADLSPTPADSVTSEEEPAGRGLGDLLSGSPLGDWALDLGELEVREARATLLRDGGTYTVSDARLAGSAEIAPSGVRLHVDTLVAHVVPPEPADSLAPGRIGSGTLVLAAHLEDGLLDLRTLSFESPRSHLAGSGRLLLAARPGLVDSVDFQLVADPLDLRDLPVPLPEPWADRPQTTVRVTARGALDSMLVQAEADGPGEAALEARAVLRTPADTLFEFEEGDAARAPTLEVSANVRGDLSPWSLGPLNGDVTAEVDLRLDSLSLRAPATVHAALVHRPSADTLGGLIGRDLRVDLDLTREAVPPQAAAEETLPGQERGLLQATATIYTAASGPGEWREAGSLHASGTERHADWRVDLELDPGSLAGRGSAQWGERIEVVVDRLALEHFDASALASRFPTTDITALVEGSLAGGAIDELSGTMALQVSPSSFAGTAVESATLRARLAPGVVEGAVMADAAGRELSSDFELTLGDSVVSATLAELRVSTPVDAAAADAAAPASSALEVRGSATGTWSLGDARRGTFSLAVDTALVAGFAMHDGTVEGRLVGDSVTARASLRVDDVLAAPAAIDAALHARGTAPADMVGLLEVSAVRAAAGDSGAALAGDVDSLAVTVSAEEPGRFVVDGSLLPAEGGRMDLDGSAVVHADSVTFDVIAGGAVGTPTRLLRGATIDTLRLEAAGVRGAEEWHALQAQLLVRRAAWRGVTADTMRLVMSADSAGLRLDTLSVQSDVLMLAGGGTLPQSGAGAGQLDFRASVQLDPLREVLEMELPEIGENAVVATVTGTTDSLEVTTALEVAAVSYGSTQIANASAEARLVIEPPFGAAFGITAGSAGLELDAIALPDTDVQNLTATLSGSPDSVRLEMSALVDGERTGELIASIDPRPEGRTARLERFHLQLDQDVWELAEPARVSYGDGYALR
ncbi:MAG TPA: hypothetical protein VMM35_08705, partial [Longimicrobiales bacterium]|nr:hypothetical protein [Longimicrobiales bacterium]